MSTKVTRRKFVTALAGLGAGSLLPAGMVFPAIKTSKTSSDPIVKGAMIGSSRGEKWGEKVNAPGYRILSSGGKLLDAVEESATVTELDPEDSSVGYGGLPNEQGVVQLDASIMDGPTHNCGAVGALEGIKTPSRVARLVMERTDHIYLVGKDAQKFAVMHGFKVENLLTEKARIRWLRWKENMSDRDDWLPPAEGAEWYEKRLTGTINILGRDSEGNFAGLTTTSGLAFKIPGRIGDSPIIGAGLYVDNEVGVAGATGRGEEVIRILGSYFVIEEMRRGKSPGEACKAACERIVAINRRSGKKKIDFNDKFVAINRKGQIGCYQIQGNKKWRPSVSWIDESGFHVHYGGYLFER